MSIATQLEKLKENLTSAYDKISTIPEIIVPTAKNLYNLANDVISQVINIVADLKIYKTFFVSQMQGVKYTGPRDLVIENDEITKLPWYCFSENKVLKKVSFPNVTTTAGYNFNNCEFLIEVNIPKCTTIGKCTFLGCYTLETLNLGTLTSIPEGAFQSCYCLKPINTEKVTSIGVCAFQNVYRNYTRWNFPLLTAIPNSAFRSTTSGSSSTPGVRHIYKEDFPKVKSIDSYAFSYCQNLEEADFAVVESIGTYAFYYCDRSFKKLVIRTPKVCTLAHINAFYTTPISSSPKDGYIYVPDDLVESYKTATNWVTYASQIKPISELEETT